MPAKMYEIDKDLFGAIESIYAEIPHSALIKINLVVMMLKQDSSFVKVERLVRNTLTITVHNVSERITKKMTTLGLSVSNGKVEVRLIP